MARALLLVTAVALFATALDGSRVLSPVLQARAQGQEPWRREFDDVCAKTQDAMTLSNAELQGLVARCDKLMPAIEAMGEPQRKIFGRRLKACRDLYAFVIESRDKDAGR